MTKSTSGYTVDSVGSYVEDARIEALIDLAIALGLANTPHAVHDMARTYRGVASAADIQKWIVSAVRYDIFGCDWIEEAVKARAVQDVSVAPILQVAQTLGLCLNDPEVTLEQLKAEVQRFFRIHSDVGESEGLQKLLDSLNIEGVKGYEDVEAIKEAIEAKVEEFTGHHGVFDE